MKAREVIAGVGGRYSITSGRLDAADRIIEALNAAGFVIVPKEPTQSMLDAGEDQLHDYDPEVMGRAPAVQRIFRDMLAAFQESEK